MKNTELIEKYNEGERSFRLADLSGASLSGANLSGANLRGANLSRANLSRANLYGADLYGADLSGADLSGANLYGADLSGADLRGANLSRANLSRAYLSRAKYGETEILSIGEIGPALSSGGHTTYLVLKDRTIHCLRGCFSGTIDEMDARSKAEHTHENRRWYESAIAHIRMSAEQVWDKRMTPDANRPNEQIED